MRELAQGNPGHLPALAKAMNNLGVYRAALAEAIPQRYRADLADGLGNAANRLSEGGKYVAAEACRQEHDRIRARLGAGRQRR